MSGLRVINRNACQHGAALAIGTAECHSLDSTVDGQPDRRHRMTAKQAAGGEVTVPARDRGRDDREDFRPPAAA